MEDPLDGIAQAFSALRDAWTSAGDRPVAERLGENDLVAVNGALGALKRHVDAVHVRIAAEIATRSRRELGPDSLAKKNGFRSPATLIAATTGSSVGDATRLVAVGDATAPRPTFSGQTAPPRHPHVAAAIARGSLGMPAAAAIIAMLDRVRLRAPRDASDAVEATLTAQAPGLSLDQLAIVIARAEAHLDPDGLAPRESEARLERSLHMFERAGRLHLTGTFDTVSAAPIKAALEAFVNVQFRRGAQPGRPGSAHDGHIPRDVCGDMGGDVGNDVGGDDAVDAPRRSVPQLQADALVAFATHLLGCAHTDVPLDGATVVVRVSLDDLTTGTGAATIDGMAQPISIAAARAMAAGGAIIPCVLGSAGEILDWGREKRLFTKAQKLALVERDGGCAMCGLPPGMTKAHHLRWWMRDAGPTDLSNGVLLCESCHHRIHDNDWEIRIDGRGVHARVWFTPPPHVDSTRTARLGGRARFDFAA